MDARREAWGMTDPGIQASVRGGVRDATTTTTTTTVAADKASVAAAATAVIPVGSLEQHGPHLPVSTDSVIASEVSRMVAEQNGYLLMPVIAYGVSYEHAPLFNASTSPDSLSQMISDLCGSLYGSGICNIIIVNGHHGNMEALGRLERLVKDSTGNGGGPAVRVFNYWRYMQRQQELGHAGFAETSMMLAISASSVRMDLAQKGLVTDGMPPERVREISELAKRSFPEATGNGVWGDPAGATAEAGRRLLGESADGISGECAEWLGGSAAQAG